MNQSAPDIPAFLDRRPTIWTFTMLNTYRGICPHQAYRRYVVKDIPYTETPAMKWGNEVHSAMELRVSGGKPLPESMVQWEPIVSAFAGKTVLCEPRLAVDANFQPTDYFGKACYGRGRADAAIVEGDRAYLGDYKTGKKREDPFELEVQAVLLQAKYPNVKTIVGQYLWLKTSEVGQLHNCSDTARTRQEIVNTMALIERDKKSGQWEKRIGPLCKYCNVKDCENNTNEDA